MFIYIVYIILLIALIFVLFLFSREIKRAKIKSMLKKHRCYEINDRFDEAEKIFFLSLCNALKGSSLLVMTHLRLADIIHVSPEIKERYNISLLKQILQWRCDFVVLDSLDFSIKAIVELDIKPYLSYENKQKNILFNIIITQAGIPLLRPRAINQVDDVATAILNIMMK